MIRQVILHCFFLHIYSFISIGIQCPDNEEYIECGSACQENCTYTPKFCTFQCVPGCFCKPGFVREIDDKSKCVPRSQCPCRVNEFFNDCGSACPDTCATKSQTCTKQCVPSCSCNNGFIRLNNQSNSPCIPESECNNTLCYDPNAEYTECGSTCPPTCDDERNPIRKFRICSTMCRRGCFCKQGFVLENNGKCVKPETCCQAIEGLYKKCSSACPQTCAHKKNVSCLLPCVSGCYCDKDYTRKNNKINSPCILKSTC
jgi:hypothetical protein